MDKRGQVKERIHKNYCGGSEIKQRDDCFNFLSDRNEKRVAVYLRSGNPPSNCGVDSFEMQKQYYREMLAKQKQCKLSDIYLDYAPSSAYRSEFERMLSDCRAGKIDLIIVKNASRFSRDIINGIKIIKELLELSPPVGVFFENENFCTLDTESMKQLSLLSYFAKEESRTKNERFPMATYYRDIERKNTMIKRRKRDGAR